jgi:uncharacterized Zn finger protein
MASYFYCQHCGKRISQNPRIKEGQEYCGCKSCQQVRKNKWETEKLKKGAVMVQSIINQKIWMHLETG